MKPEYATWITTFIETQCMRTSDGGRYVRGMCAFATAKMIEAFPELTRVRGHVVGGGPHWWCVTAEGEIVDPTRAQFGPGPLEYEPFDESRAAELPTGKCVGCGDHLYYDAKMCSEECQRAVCLDMGVPFFPSTYNPTDRPCYYAV